MSPRKFSAAIFDLDGVLVDTAESHFLAWRKLAQELEVDFDRTANQAFKGVSRMRCIQILLQDSDIPCEQYEELANRKNGYYLEMIARLTPADVLPGMRELLQNLKTNRVKTGVASASRNAMEVLQRLDILPLIDRVVDGIRCPVAKPAPDVFLMCAGELGVEPEDAVVVEDAQAGIDAARAGNMFCVGVGALQGADLVVANTAEIPVGLWI